MVRNGVAANLMMAFILVSGIFAAPNTNEEIFPEMELDRINVEVPYLGAAPEEVEEVVNVWIEEAIQGVDGIKQIQSTGVRGDGHGDDRARPRRRRKHEACREVEAGPDVGVAAVLPDAELDARSEREAVGHDHLPRALERRPKPGDGCTGRP